MEADYHKKKIHGLKYTNMSDNEYLQHVILSASEDGSVKVWDRRNGQKVSELKSNNSPFYSVDTNKSMICAGTSKDVIFWDLRKMKPVVTYDESHTDDVTAVKFHPTNPNWLLTCSLDYLVCQFDFTSKPSINEEDTMEGVYCSTQPLNDCGFINNDMFWALTSVNTIEICNIELAD